MIPLLVILLTIHGTNTMHGDSHSDAALQFFVSICSSDKLKCSGSILDPLHILTAGHCVNTIPASSLRVFAGSTKHKNLQEMSVETVRFHDDFKPICPGNEVYWQNDIAIVKLSEPLNWESTITAVPLIDKGFTWKIGKLRALYGWDQSTVNDVKTLSLRWSGATNMENEICEALEIDLLENEGCLKNAFQSTVLDDGDYGAVVMAKDTAVGITIRGGDHGASPPVILNIYPYLDFIASVLNVKLFNIPGVSPYYVVIFHYGSHLCGGSIIGSRHILTAAHCFEDTKEENLAVLAGRSEFSMTGLLPSELLLVEHFQNHPDFELIPGEDGTAILRNDISVLTASIPRNGLQQPLTWSDTISAIALDDYVPIRESCLFHRWSRTFNKQGKKVTSSWWSGARILDDDTCEVVAGLGAGKFCTLNLYPLSIGTAGDSGSPIVCNGVSVAGIWISTMRVERTAGAPLEVLHYTSIPVYRKFITDAIAGRIPKSP